MSFSVFDLRVEHETEPLALECQVPRFFWKIQSVQSGVSQKSYRICVTQRGTGAQVWDSGICDDDATAYIAYQGDALRPRSYYDWQVTVCDESGCLQTAASFFGTGLMYPAPDAWQGAQWIGIGKPSLAASVKSVFSLTVAFRIPEGSCTAGVVFGANDDRLREAYRNTLGSQTDSRVIYQVDISAIPAKLTISFVGFGPNASGSSTLVVDIKDPGNIPITEANMHDLHALRIDVLGNTAAAYIDGVCVDATYQKLPFVSQQTPPAFSGRQLNPLGQNDVTTYPRLNQIAFLPPREGAAHYYSLTVSDLRPPCATLFSLCPADDHPALPVENGYFIITSAIPVENILLDPSHGGIPVLRRVFEAKSILREARLFVSARGVYTANVNGKPLTVKGKTPYFSPGASQFDRHLYYNLYDVTGLLDTGLNAMGFMLSSGWWSDSQTFTLQNHNYFGNVPSLLVMMELCYTDGTRECVTSHPDSWTCTDDGPVRYGGFFNGEHFDARRRHVIDGFDTPTFDDAAWRKAEAVTPVPMPSADTFPLAMWPSPNHTEPQMIAHSGAPVTAVETLTAKSMTEPRPGVYVYDMGQNMAGVPQIRLRGHEGMLIRLRYAEVLYPDLPEYGDRKGLLMVENLRDADCTDRYICGGGEETYSPTFTFHGYRYLEISGLSGALPLSDVKGLVLSSISETTGSFTSSSPLLNRLYDNICWSQRANFISIPTDCPQRNERMGWMGDAQVFAPTAVYNADALLFFCRFLQAARDLQSEAGVYPNIAPVGGGFGGIAWESAGVLIPWTLYRQYGDIRVLQVNFNAMKRYAEYLAAHVRDGLVYNVGQLGDWLATDVNTDNELLWNAIALKDIEIVRNTAALLGKQDTAALFERLYLVMHAAWNDTFIDPFTGKTRTKGGTINDTQCSYALPLYYGIVCDEHILAFAARLNEKTVALDYALTTGFLGTPCIAHALADHGYVDTAYRLLLNVQYPSWLYPVAQGATTIWERWNSYTHENGFGGNNSMNSFNHYSLGAVGEWIYNRILGIAPDPQDPGFKRFILRPLIHMLAYARGHYDSLYGRIECEWNLGEDQITLKITVPANTAARLLLPAGLGTVTGTLSTPVTEEGGLYIAALTGGTYVFTIA